VTRMATTPTTVAFLLVLEEAHRGRADANDVEGVDDVGVAEPGSGTDQRVLG